MNMGKFEPMESPMTTRPDDIPLNKMCFYVALACVGAFCFYNLSSCTQSRLTTPAYVQAIQACNALSDARITVDESAKLNNHYTTNLNITPDVLATIEKCQANVRENFASGREPVITKISPGSLGDAAKELLTKKE
jgi:hypothetical protein